MRWLQSGTHLMRLWSCTCTCTRAPKGNFLGKIPYGSVGAMHGFILGVVLCIRHDGVVEVVVVGKASFEALIRVWWVTWRRGQREQWGKDGGIKTLWEKVCSRVVIIMVFEIVLVHAEGGVVVVLLWHGDKSWDLWFDPRENTRKVVNFLCWKDWIKLHEG